MVRDAAENSTAIEPTKTLRNPVTGDDWILSTRTGRVLETRQLGSRLVTDDASDYLDYQYSKANSQQPEHKSVQNGSNVPEASGEDVERDPTITDPAEVADAFIAVIHGQQRELESASDRKYIVSYLASVLKIQFAAAQRAGAEAMRERAARRLEALAIDIRENGPRCKVGLLTGVAGTHVGVLLDAARTIRSLPTETDAPIPEETR